MSNNSFQPLQIGIALFRDIETREDLHWALVVHQTNVRAPDVNMYHIRLRPSTGSREWLPAHTTIFGSYNAVEGVFPDTGPRSLRHQHSCIGVVHVGMIRIPGPHVLRRFHDWILTFGITYEGNDLLGLFLTEREWCSAGWVIRIIQALETGWDGDRAMLGVSHTNLLCEEHSGMKMDIRNLYGRVHGLTGRLREIKRCSRMRDAVPMISIWPNHIFLN